MNYFLVLSFGQVTPDRQTDRQTDRRTESDAYEPTMHMHRCAQLGMGVHHVMGISVKTPSGDKLKMNATSILMLEPPP